MKIKLLFLLLCVTTVAMSQSINLSTFTSLYPVKKEGKWGYINNKGEVKIELKYESAFDFSEGKAFVKEEGKIKFIDKEGDVVLEVTNASAVKPAFSEGMVPFMTAEGAGFLDAKGEVAIDPVFEDAEPFEDGLAIVKDKITQKWGFINKTGEYKILPQFGSVQQFSEGIAPVRFDGTWGFINKSGKVEIMHRYTYAMKFSEGYTLVWPYSEVARYIDTKGEEVFRHKIFESVDNLPEKFKLPIAGFSDGMVAVYDPGMKRWGYKNKKGEQEIAYTYEDAGDFVSGLAKVQSGGKWGFINKNAKLKIRYQFDDAEDFNSNITRVYMGGSKSEFEAGKEDVKMGYINKNGEFIWAASN